MPFRLTAARWPGCSQSERHIFFFSFIKASIKSLKHIFLYIKVNFYIKSKIYFSFYLILKKSELK